jgi:hypothetical protein
MVKPNFRTRSVSTKVTEEEYARLEEKAGGRIMSEWVREILLQALQPVPEAVASADLTSVMSEVLAMRSLMLNILFRVSNGQTIDEAEMRRLIAEADEKKHKKALDSLAANRSHGR